MWWCRGLRFRITTAQNAIKQNAEKAQNPGDLPGTHFRNWINTAASIKLAATPTKPDNKAYDYEFKGSYEISSRFDWFSGGWTALTVALMTCVIVFFVTLSTAANEVYGVSPTDKFAPSPKKFKDRVFWFGIWTGSILGLLFGIIVAHIKTTPRGNFFFGMMVLLGAAGSAGFIAALTTPQTDDSDIRVFYTDRGLAKVSGSSGYVIRCLFMSVCLFLFVAVLVYFLTSYCINDRKYISNMDDPYKYPSGQQPIYPFFGAGSYIRDDLPQAHQIRHGFLTYSTLRFVNADSTQKAPRQIPSLPSLPTGSPQVSVALAGTQLAEAVAGSKKAQAAAAAGGTKAQPVRQKFIMNPGNRENPAIQEEVLSKDKYLIQVIDWMIPISLLVIVFLVFRIINIMSALSHIMKNIENKEKKAAFDRSYQALLFFFWIILGIIAVLLIMWVCSYACWASLISEYDEWKKAAEAAAAAAQQQQAPAAAQQQKAVVPPFLGSSSPDNQGQSSIDSSNSSSGSNPL